MANVIKKKDKKKRFNKRVCNGQQNYSKKKKVLGSNSQAEYSLNTPKKKFYKATLWVLGLKQTYGEGKKGLVCQFGLEGMNCIEFF